MGLAVLSFRLTGIVLGAGLLVLAALRLSVRWGRLWKNRSVLTDVVTLTVSAALLIVLAVTVPS